MTQNLADEPTTRQQDRLIWSRVLCAAEAAAERKAEDPVVLDLRETTQIADYFVIFSGRSDTQVRAIADAIQQECRLRGARPLSVEGVSNGQWVLIDYGDFVVHVFYEPVRRFYDIDRLWAHAPRCPTLPDTTEAPRMPSQPPAALDGPEG